MKPEKKDHAMSALDSLMSKPSRKPKRPAVDDEEDGEGEEPSIEVEAGAEEPGEDSEEAEEPPASGGKQDPEELIASIQAKLEELSSML